MRLVFFYLVVMIVEVSFWRQKKKNHYVYQYLFQIIMRLMLQKNRICGIPALRDSDGKWYMHAENKAQHLAETACETQRYHGTDSRPWAHCCCMCSEIAQRHTVRSRMPGPCACRPASAWCQRRPLWARPRPASVRPPALDRSPSTMRAGLARVVALRCARARGAGGGGNSGP